MLNPIGSKRDLVNIVQDVVNTKELKPEKLLDVLSAAEKYIREEKP